MIVDVRDYTVRADRRDLLIERAETAFFPEQERLGATILGAFRDADDAARWVWLRGAPDLATRARVLTAFYVDGAMWAASRDEINAWIVDSDNVLLMRPASEWMAPAQGPSVVGMYSYLRGAPPSDAAALDRRVIAAIGAAGGRPLATLATDPVENNFPRHPIRTGEHGMVWLATFAVYAPLALDIVEQRRLIPTPSSRLR